MNKYWDFIEDGSYITLQSCDDINYDGEKILDEIVEHFKRHNKTVKEQHYIIIDTFLLEYNTKEHKRFKNRMNFYLNKGYIIHETY